MRIYYFWIIFGLFLIDYVKSEKDKGDDSLLDMPDFSEKVLHPYMLELYDIYSDKHQPKLKYNNANIIRGFTNKDLLTDNWHYFFNMSDAVSKDEEILEAEFCFYTDREAIGLQEDSIPSIKIQLFEGRGNGTSIELLEERSVSTDTSKWEVFGVKESVKRWRDSMELNRGFTLYIQDSTGQDIQNRTQLQKNGQQPILIVYSRNSKITKSTLLDPEVSGLLQAKYTDEKLSKRSHRRNIRGVAKSKSNLCGRHDFRIDFGDIGWLDWVITPKSYNAYACRRACVFGKNQNSTAHARMQSLVHHLGLTTETPCCVPTELYPLSILFYDKDSNPIMAQFDEMIIAECGCR